MTIQADVIIRIGEYFASKNAVIATTLLGSCVSACLFDPIAKVGGMNHILSVNNPGLDQDYNSARYGLQAMEQLINEMVKLGAVRSRLQCKIFGGGQMLKMSKSNSPGPNNVAFVKKYLHDEKIELIAQNTGGPFSRKIYFVVNTFEVLLKRRAARNKEEIESAFEPEGVVRVKAIAHKPGEITLFD